MCQKVIIGFLASATLAFATIILLYLRSALAKDICNEIDTALLAGLKRAFTRTKAGEDGEHAQPQWGKESKARQGAIDGALFDLLKSQNDQLLLLGIALTLSVYVKFSELDQFSAYAFRMSISTAWFTCVVNMSIMSVFRGRESDVKALWRVVAMSLHLILIAPLVLIASLPIFAIEPSLSVRCALQRLSSSSASQKAASVLQSSIFVALVLGGYIRRLDGLAEMQLRNAISKLLGRRRPIDVSVYREGYKRESFKERSRDERLTWACEPRVGNFRAVGAFVRVLLHDLSHSFLWELFCLAFYFTFGLTSLIVSWTSLPPLSQWSRSFGQLVPLFSLLFFLTPAYDKYKSAFGEHPSYQRIFQANMLAML